MKQANKVMMTKEVNENIVVGDNSMSAYQEIAPGFDYAYDKQAEKAGIVDTRLNVFFPTVPLNGWRGRELAETVLGVRDASVWKLDWSLIVDARTLQELPGFDSQNQEIVDAFEGEVFIHVVRVDPNYGAHIRIINIKED